MNNLMTILLMHTGLNLAAAREQPSTDGTFSCNDLVSGYYADMDGECTGYYMCSNQSVQGIRFSCPTGTKFKQQSLVCDHDHRVECKESPKYFHYNSRIGIKHAHFLGKLKKEEYLAEQSETASDLREVSAED